MKHLLQLVATLLLASVCVLAFSACGDLAVGDAADAAKAAIREGYAIEVEHEDDYGINYVYFWGDKGINTGFTICFFSDKKDAETFYNRENQRTAVLDGSIVYYGDTDAAARILEGASGNSDKGTLEYAAVKLISEDYELFTDNAPRGAAAALYAEREVGIDQEEEIDIYFFDTEAAAEAYYNEQKTTWDSTTRYEDDGASRYTHGISGTMVYYGTEDTVNMIK